MQQLRRRVTVLALAALLTTSGTAVGQEREAPPDKPKAKPELRVRVVTDARSGVPVVVQDAAEAPGAERIEVRPGVTIIPQAGATIPPAGATGSEPQPEVENWLQGGPASSAPAPADSWLNAPAAPAAAPTASGRALGTPDISPTPAPTTELVGVNEYLAGTRGGATPATGDGPSAPVMPVPPRAAPDAGLPAAAATGAPATTPRYDATAGTYRLGPGDQLDIHVWRNDELSKQVPVRPDGMISLPLVGEIPASGKTTAQLETEITAALREYVQMPTVTVTVTEIRGFVVYVLGRVGSPGTVVLDRPVNVIQAIAMAGGLQEFADRNGVVVIRNIGGRQVRMPFRYGDAVKGKGEIENIVLQSGDVVYVP